MRRLGVGLVVVAYNQPAWTERLVDAARAAKNDVAIVVYLHSADPATVAACERIALDVSVDYRPYGENRGLARTWNEGILACYEAGADIVIVANDDVAPGPGDLDRIAAKASSCPDRYLVSCAGYHERLGRFLPSHGYSCFAINPIALETIGCFDENFFPAYCEDQDYARRAGLAGLSEENCPDTNVTHGGSSAISASAELARQNAFTQARNMAYYGLKWGGGAGDERFTTPFGEPRFGVRIAPESRAAPYGEGYDRSDRDIVAV